MAIETSLGTISMCLNRNQPDSPVVPPNIRYNIPHIAVAVTTAGCVSLRESTFRIIALLLNKTLWTLFVLHCLTV